MSEERLDQSEAAVAQRARGARPKGLEWDLGFWEVRERARRARESDDETEDANEGVTQ